MVVQIHDAICNNGWCDCFISLFPSCTSVLSTVPGVPNSLGRNKREERGRDNKVSHIVWRLLRFERYKVLGHKTKVTPQNRSFAASLLTSVIIDCVEIEWTVIQWLDGAGKGLQRCWGYNFFVFFLNGSELNKEKGREVEHRSVRIWIGLKFNN